jgi:AraC-like DNA-binding protein
MYNDAGLSGTAPDPTKQALGAVLCSVVSAEYALRVGQVAWKSGIRRAKRPTLAQRAQEALSRDLRRTGRDLAREFGVSGAFLAREFKREMGVSLVEYRNRARLDRFQQLMQEHPAGLPLKHAARQAGFGSYAQFNRVHRSMFGTSYAARGSRAGVALASDTADSEVTGGPA